MTPAQKNKIFKVISEKELDWIDFSDENIESKGNSIGSKLIHLRTGFFFEFYFVETHEGMAFGEWRITHTPGRDYKPKELYLFVTSWEKLIEIFQVWLVLLKNEIDSQSFLDKLFSYQISFKENINRDIFSDQPFSDEESKTIRLQLEAFKIEVNNLQALDTEISQINQKIDYLIDRLNKKYPKIDMINIYVSTAFQLLVSEGLEIAKSPIFIERVKLLFHLITGGKFLN